MKARNLVLAVPCGILLSACSTREVEKPAFVFDGSHCLNQCYEPVAQTPGVPMKINLDYIAPAPARDYLGPSGPPVRFTQR